MQSKSTPTDLVSAADQAAEELIRARLAAARPGDGFLGEEGGDGTGQRAGCAGSSTRSTARSTSCSASRSGRSAIAVEDADGVLAGVVYDPPRDELWAAERGGPRLLDGEPGARLRRARSSATALVATGFGYEAEVRRAQAATIAALLPEVRDIRRFGSAALDLAWTAAGRYDAYYERGIQRWDVAAGGLHLRARRARGRAARAGAAAGRGDPRRAARADGRAARRAWPDPRRRRVGRSA